MTRPSGGFTGTLLLVAQRAFVSGCSGCLGAGLAALTSLVLVFGVFQPQLVTLLRVISLPSPPFVISVQPGPTVVPLPAAEIAEIDIFVTGAKKTAAARITEVKLPVQEPLFICAQGAKPTSARFAVRITMPDGRVIPFGEFVSDPMGKVVCLGPLVELPATPGVLRIEAVAGTAVVGTTTLTIVA